MRRYNLFYFIGQALRGLWRNGVMSFASIAVLMSCLVVIGGFTLLSTHPFHSGDFVEIAGQSGTVEEISMTYTKLATPDNKLISIPNSAVVAAQIVNYSALGLRRVDIDVAASYDTPAQQVVPGRGRGHAGGRRHRGSFHPDRARKALCCADELRRELRQLHSAFLGQGRRLLGRPVHC